MGAGYCAAVLVAVAGPCKDGLCADVGPSAADSMRKFGKVRNWFIGAFAVGTAWAMAIMYLVKQPGHFATYAAATEAEQLCRVGGRGRSSARAFLISQSRSSGADVLPDSALECQRHAHHHDRRSVGQPGSGVGCAVPGGLAFTLCLIGLALKNSGEQIRMNMRQRVWTGFYARPRCSYHAVHADCLDSGVSPW